MSVKWLVKETFSTCEEVPTANPTRGGEVGAGTSAATAGWGLWGVSVVGGGTSAAIIVVISTTGTSVVTLLVAGATSVGVWVSKEGADWRDNSISNKSRKKLQGKLDRFESRCCFYIQLGNKLPRLYDKYRNLIAALVSMNISALHMRSRRTKI